MVEQAFLPLGRSGECINQIHGMLEGREEAQVAKEKNLCLHFSSLVLKCEFLFPQFEYYCFSSIIVVHYKPFTLKSELFFN